MHDALRRQLAVQRVDSGDVLPAAGVLRDVPVGACPQVDLNAVAGDDPVDARAGITTVP
jgi:hypothetical protein